MNLYTVPFYKNAPFIRLIFPLVSGILIQWTCNFQFSFLFPFFALVAILLSMFSIWGMKIQYLVRAIRGAFINILVVLTGCLCLYLADDRNNAFSLLNTYENTRKLLITIAEPLSAKPGSYKTTAHVNALIDAGRYIKTEGTILVYFEKQPVHAALRFGDVLLVSAPLQPISRTGNPAAFDYRQYCFFKGIHHQVFLNSSSYIITGIKTPNALTNLIFKLREKVVAITDKFIPGPKESGLAQALLIGYKDNLDKELIQAYSNTGVVHVIAISGLHLGLIYSILVLATARLRHNLQKRLVQLVIVLTGIWIFAIVAGASASVVRSAVMFTCIAIGKVMDRNLSVYNSLAASAFLLLCYNPFWLWDTGFLLSYAAVLSIIVYQKAVFSCLPVTNKLMLMAWKTCAITLSAQILTTPVSLYYFHQFPNFFLVTNFVAIPLSSIILMAEIILCCVSVYSPLATLVGWLIHNLIALMNWFVELIGTLPFANWQGLQISLLQELLLYAVIAGVTLLTMAKFKSGMFLALFGLLFFFLLRSFSFADAVNQQKLIVYNITKTTAVELIVGRNLVFIGDSSATCNESVFRFNIAPSRIYHRISSVYSPQANGDQTYLLSCNKQLILLISGPVNCRVQVNVMIISGNPRGSLSNLISGRLPKLVVFDSSNAGWRVKAWKKDCQKLNLAYRSVAEEGAFVMNLN